MIDVRSFTVGPVQENCYFVRRPDAESAVIVDPGDEAARLLEAIDAARHRVASRRFCSRTATSITSARSRPLHDATGAPVWCPELETEMLANINAYTLPWVRAVRELRRPITRSPAARRSSSPGSRFDVRFTPGHSPGHVTYAVRDEARAALR